MGQVSLPLPGLSSVIMQMSCLCPFALQLAGGKKRIERIAVSILKYRPYRAAIYWMQPSTAAVMAEIYPQSEVIPGSYRHLASTFCPFFLFTCFFEWGSSSVERHLTKVFRIIIVLVCGVTLQYFARVNSRLIGRLMRWRRPFWGALSLDAARILFLA